MQLFADLVYRLRLSAQYGLDKNIGLELLYFVKFGEGLCHCLSCFSFCAFVCVLTMCVCACVRTESLHGSFIKLLTKPRRTTASSFWKHVTQQAMNNTKPRRTTASSFWKHVTQQAMNTQTKNTALIDRCFPIQLCPVMELGPVPTSNVGAIKTAKAAQK